jgi:predicted MFS family arabinose efflux permease
MCTWLSGLSAPLIIDRFRLDSFLWMSEMGQTICFGLMCVLFNLLPSQWLIPTILFMVLAISILNGWGTLARNALAPRLVPPDFLVKANSLLATSDQIVLLAGWSIGGILIVGLGIIQVLWITTIMMFLSALALFFVKDPSKIVPSNQKKSKPWDRMKEGWSII